MARRSAPGSLVRLVLETGTRVAGPRVVLCARPGSGRTAVVVGRKIGNAVQRNRSKRILRAALRDAASYPTEDLDIVLLARTTIHGASSTDLSAEVNELIQTLKAKH